MKLLIPIIALIFDSYFGFCQVEGSLSIPDAKWSKKYLIKQPNTDLVSNFIEKDTIKLKYTIDTLKGKLNGKCKIWNFNNELLISGKFHHNQKKGIWNFNFFDSTRVQFARRYQNSYTFKQLAPNKNTRELKYPTTKNDSLGYIVYPSVSDDEVYTYKTNWRYIPNNENNKHIFEENKMWYSLMNDIKNDIDVYSDSYFSKTYDKNELLEIMENTDIEVIGYKTKDLFYCNKTYCISATRLIGLCPVIKINNKEKELCWFFYPYIRNSLSKISLNETNQISTMEDVFHMSYYDSFIYELECLDGEDPSTMKFLNPNTTSELKKFSIKNEIHHLYLEWKFLQSECH